MQYSALKRAQNAWFWYYSRIKLILFNEYRDLLKHHKTHTHTHTQSLFTRMSRRNARSIVSTGPGLFQFDPIDRKLEKEIFSTSSSEDEGRAAGRKKRRHKPEQGDETEATVMPRAHDVRKETRGDKKPRVVNINYSCMPPNVGGGARSDTLATSRETARLSDERAKMAEAQVDKQLERYNDQLQANIDLQARYDELLGQYETNSTAAVPALQLEVSKQRAEIKKLSDELLAARELHRTFLVNLDDKSAELRKLFEAERALATTANASRDIMARELESTKESLTSLRDQHAEDKMRLVAHIQEARRGEEERSTLRFGIEKAKHDTQQAVQQLETDMARKNNELAACIDEKQRTNDRLQKQIVDDQAKWEREKDVAVGIMQNKLDAYKLEFDRNTAIQTTEAKAAITEAKSQYETAIAIARTESQSLRAQLTFTQEHAHTISQHQEETVKSRLDILRATLEADKMAYQARADNEVFKLQNQLKEMLADFVRQKDDEVRLAKAQVSGAEAKSTIAAANQLKNEQMGERIMENELARWKERAEAAELKAGEMLAVQVDLAKTKANVETARAKASQLVAENEAEHAKTLATAKSALTSELADLRSTKQREIDRLNDELTREKRKDVEYETKLNTSKKAMQAEHEADLKTRDSRERALRATHQAELQETRSSVQRETEKNMRTQYQEMLANNTTVTKEQANTANAAIILDKDVEIARLKRTIEELQRQVDRTMSLTSQAHMAADDLASLRAEMEAKIIECQQKVTKLTADAVEDQAKFVDMTTKCGYRTTSDFYNAILDNATKLALVRAPGQVQGGNATRQLSWVIDNASRLTAQDYTVQRYSGDPNQPVNDEYLKSVLVSNAAWRKFSYECGYLTDQNMRKALRAFLHSLTPVWGIAVNPKQVFDNIPSFLAGLNPPGPTHVPWPWIEHQPDAPAVQED